MKGIGLLRPGFTDLLGVFLVVLVVLGGSHRLFNDADAATHVATGLWILEHREVPIADPFSGTRAGTEWFAHEWLADLASALAWRAGSWAGLLAAAAILIALAHVLLFRFLVLRGDDVVAAFGAVVAAAATASSHWLARPHLLTVLFLVVWTLILEQVCGGRLGRGALAFLPPLALVWANVHGGFLVAFVVLGCYLAGALLHPRGRPLLGPLLAAGAVSGACILINPWGWRLPRHLIAFFGSKGPALRATSEFAPAAFDDRAGAALLAFLVLCVAGIVCGLLWRPASRNEPPRGGTASAAPRNGTGSAARPGAADMPFHPGTLLALAVTVVMALLSIRHVEIMTVIGALVISGGASAFLRLKADAPARALLEALRAREARCGGGALIAVFVLLSALALTGGLPRAGFDPALFPVRAVAALRQSGTAPEGPVFSPDVWGGYLILEWPQARVFVDGRWDMYGDDFFGRYADIYLARPGWPAPLREAGVTLALLPHDAPLVPAMQASAEWERLLADETAVVFRRRGSIPPS